MGMAASTDFISVSDAARELGVEQSRVRALLSRGQLDGEKVGGRWLVSRRSVRQRQSNAPKRGRRLRPANAWAVLALASSEAAPWVSAEERRRVADLLEARGFVDLVGRMSERARVEELYAHPGVMSSIQQSSNIVPAGAHAARDVGEKIVVGEGLDFYISEPDLPELVREYVLEPSDQPNLRVRVVPEGLWPFRDRRMPLAAVAVDLADLPDARSRRVGNQLIDQIGRSVQGEPCRVRPLR